MDPGIQSLPVFCVEITRGDHNDRDVTPQWLFLQGSNDLEAVHLWHHQIEQDHVWLVGPQQIQCLASITGLMHEPLLADQPVSHMSSR